jgi:aspartate carbamoyltransferase catalytic subunit
MRSEVPDFAEKCAHLMNRLEGFNRRNVPIINGGAGADQHPTQALLDMYTLQRTFDFDHTEQTRHSRWLDLRKKYSHLERGLDNKVYGFCGDLGRGRTVRSLARILSEYDNVSMYFISPDHHKLSLGVELRNKLLDANVNLHEFDSLDATIEGKPILEEMDCLYMTRIQQEHDTDEDKEAFRKIELGKYHLTMQRVQQMKEYAAILHPFPRDSEIGEIPTEIDTDPRAMYFRQARNGMWARAALLIHLFDVSDDLMTIYRDQGHEHSDYNRDVLG